MGLKTLGKVLALTAALAIGGAIGCKLPDMMDQTKNDTSWLEKALSKQYANLVLQHKSGNTLIRKGSGTITLNWENGSSNIEVDYRQRFTQTWTSLGAPTGLNPSGTSSSDITNLSPGLYEFAVYDKDPRVNTMRTSLDSYAQPPNGWYLMYGEYPEADADKNGIISDSEMTSFIKNWQKGKYTDQQFQVNADYYLSEPR